MARNYRVVSLVCVAFVLSAAMGGCTATGSGSGARQSPGTDTAHGTATSVPTTGCVQTTDLSDAHDGVISAGPFKENQGRWLDGTKLWVETSVDQKPTSATIRARRLDAPAPTVTERRGEDTIAVPDGNPPGLFFPGLFQLSHHGSWRITVTIGSDVGCFLVHA